ncbi:MAG: prolipoprotein diacylglyceryl transferase [Candidatus Peregrinibacteria bacterium]|nr:prolipoprotein diacylglyceryl transferase [Candidatus Peregrinibacteria bacterium]MDZ4244883.1 prolipoprotein diacylglyceryl transferase family protein [Candidatus Gracilibacteria bacterium]
MYPTLFEIGPFIISTIWIFIIAGFFIFIQLLIKSLQKKRDDFKLLYENSSFIIISFIIGARIVHVISNASYYFYEINLRSIFSIFAFWDKGFSFWGGLLSSVIALLYITRKNKESFKKWMDYVMGPFLYALPVVYIGKLFDGIGYGSKTDLPIGIAFKNMDIPIISPVHPTQIYGTVLFCISIFITREYFKRKKEDLRIQGFKATFIIMLISTSLFIENIFRGDTINTIFNISITLYLSFIITAASCIYLRQLKKQAHGNQ